MNSQIRVSTPTYRLLGTSIEKQDKQHHTLQKRSSRAEHLPSTTVANVKNQDNDWFNTGTSTLHRHLWEMSCESPESDIVPAPLSTV